MPVKGKIGGDLDKKIPQSKKYVNIKPKVDSGSNSRKFTEKVTEAQLNARFQRQELFRRITWKGLQVLYSSNEVDLLLLDLREQDAFEECHITGAVNYPARLLTRAVNGFTEQILAYANKEPHKVILLYDADEKIAVAAGNYCFEKGLDNAFVLTGGLNLLITKCPDLTTSSDVTRDVGKPPALVNSRAAGPIPFSTAAGGAAALTSFQSSFNRGLSRR